MFLKLYFCINTSVDFSIKGSSDFFLLAEGFSMKIGWLLTSASESWKCWENVLNFHLSLCSKSQLSITIGFTNSFRVLLDGFWSAEKSSNWNSFCFWSQIFPKRPKMRKVELFLLNRRYSNSWVFKFLHGFNTAWSNVKHFYPKIYVTKVYKLKYQAIR